MVPAAEQPAPIEVQDLVLSVYQGLLGSGHSPHELALLVYDRKARPEVTPWLAALRRYHQTRRVPLIEAFDRYRGCVGTEKGAVRALVNLDGAAAAEFDKQRGGAVMPVLAILETISIGDVRPRPVVTKEGT